MASQLYYHLLPIHTIINTSIKFTQKRRRLMALLLPCNRWVAFLVLSFPLVFGAPSVQAQTPGPSQSSGLTLNRQQAGSQSRLDFVNVKFEVDGKEKKKNFKIVLYLNNQIIEPLLVEGGFLVPPELKNQEHVDVRFKSGRYDLFSMRYTPQNSRVTGSLELTLNRSIRPMPRMKKLRTPRLSVTSILKPE